MEFIEAPAFARHIAEYLDDESYAALQNELAENPEAGDVIPRTGGFRKVRWADPRRGKGRRGGLRVIYYYSVGLSDFARDGLWQGRSRGPDPNREESTEERHRGGTQFARGSAFRATIAPEEEELMAKRKLFDEMMEGVAAMKSHREGKLTLRTYKIEPTKVFKVDSRLIKETRERLNCSRAVFARKLHINERTLEKWEQGRAKPNPQAAALLLLVRRYPDTLKRLEQLAS